MSISHIFTPILGSRYFTAGIFGDRFVYACSDGTQRALVLSHVDNLRVYFDDGSCCIHDLGRNRVSITSGTDATIPKKIADTLKRVFVAGRGLTFDTSSVFLGVCEAPCPTTGGDHSFINLGRATLCLHIDTGTLVLVWNGATADVSGTVGLLPDMAHGFVAKPPDVKIEKQDGAFLFWVNGAPHTRLEFHSVTDTESVWDKLRNWVPPAVTFINNPSDSLAVHVSISSA